MTVINKHQNDQWLHCHSISCARLLNIGLNMEAYLYDLKICDTNYRHVTDSIFRPSHLSDILSSDRPCRINGFWLYITNYNYGIIIIEDMLIINKIIFTSVKRYILSYPIIYLIVTDFGNLTYLSMSIISTF